MNCHKSRYLIHLDRPGERTDAEQAALDNHLPTCFDCRSEADIVVRSRAKMEALSLYLTPETASAEIVPRILNELPERSSLNAHASSVLDRLDRPFIRFAYGCVVIAAAVGLITQSMGVSDWKRRPAEIAGRVETPVHRPVLVYNVDAASVHAVHVSGLFSLQDLTAGGGNDRRFEIRQDEVAQLLQIADQHLVRSLGIPANVRSRIAEAVAALAREVNVSVRLSTSGVRP